jgi:hypothetical protein
MGGTLLSAAFDVDVDFAIQEIEGFKRFWQVKTQVKERRTRVSAPEARSSAQPFPARNFPFPLHRRYIH